MSFEQRDEWHHTSTPTADAVDRAATIRESNRFGHRGLLKRDCQGRPPAAAFGGLRPLMAEPARQSVAMRYSRRDHLSTDAGREQCERPPNAITCRPILDRQRSGATDGA